MFSFFKKDNAPAPAELPAGKQPDAPSETEQPGEKKGWLGRLKDGLSRTRAQLGNQISSLFSSHGKIDEELYEELETILLTSDVGVDATQALLDALRKEVRKQKLEQAEDLKQALQQVLAELLAPLEQPLINTTGCSDMAIAPEDPGGGLTGKSSGQVPEPPGRAARRGSARRSAAAPGRRHRFLSRHYCSPRR